ncbi:MAG TPA: family 20 glycosylhydrolase [Steroidobacteraceae bacterium]|nr:family 20 glycosylhydrolase [Steroidobacteraceae bacterium]
MIRGAGAAVVTAGLALASVFGAAPASAQQAAVIPLPAKIVPGTGAFAWSAATVIQVPRGQRDAANAAGYLSDLWKRSNGITLPVLSHSARPAASVIRFEQRPGYGPEAYRLEVGPHRITVSASTAAGLFYGAVTLWQLLPVGPKRGAIPAQTIIDQPRYSWRGLMLDSSRHFQSPAFVRRMIDWMAWHKLNILHWHLTDDQGWRLEIRKYPRLTSVGAWRIPAAVPGAATPKVYGGFYTQAEVREIVRFAASRHVQIVPEIDMPGHAQAAIAAYPELGSIDAKPSLPVSNRWGVHSHLFNLEPSTFEFIENVLGEVLQLFPSHFIHIGGDEAVKDEWKASAAVQARAHELDIHDAAALQTYFTQKIGQYLTAHGRRAVGWDEIMQPGLATDAVVMSWHGAAGAHAAAIRGNDAVLAPDPALYFDHRQSSLASEPPGRLAVISLEDVYRFEPHDPQLTENQQRHILGLQANLWTEHMQTEQRVEWMALPRAAAVAEIGWSPQTRSWPDFLERLSSMSARYRAFDLHYADSVYGIQSRFTRGAGAISVALSNLPELQHAVLDVAIRYTLDGREPNAASAVYAQPLKVSVGSEIRAATFIGPAQVSRVWTAHLDAHAGVRRTSHELDLCSDGVGLLLEPRGARTSGDAPPGDAPLGDAPLAVDIMNPCWIYRDIDLAQGPPIAAAVSALPFNYELGQDAAKIRVGDNRTPAGELEVRVDGCDGRLIGVLPLPPAATAEAEAELPAYRLPVIAGRHDVCLRFARPSLDPLWALDWAEIGA